MDSTATTIPKIGMVGASYGGGIQLATAAIDHRIDAIVPTIAWHRPDNVAVPEQAVRSGGARSESRRWCCTCRGRTDPARGDQRHLTGRRRRTTSTWSTNAAYADQLGDITAPTLLVQGTVDTLFTLAQADANARALIDAGTPTKVVWYCGGHGACLTPRTTARWSAGDDGVAGQATSRATRTRRPARGSSGSTRTALVLVGHVPGAGGHDAGDGGRRLCPRRLPYIPFIGGSGPNPRILTRGSDRGDPRAAVGGACVNAVNLQVPDATETTHIVGAPELTLTYSGTGNATHVYAQIVDDKTHLVLGNLATSIPVVLDGETHESRTRWRRWRTRSAGSVGDGAGHDVDDQLPELLLLGQDHGRGDEASGCRHWGPPSRRLLLPDAWLWLTCVRPSGGCSICWHPRFAASAIDDGFGDK